MAYYNEYFETIFCPFCNKETKHSILDECICSVDQGGGYTYSDEYGDCPYCLNEIYSCTICNLDHSNGE